MDNSRFNTMAKQKNVFSGEKKSTRNNFNLNAPDLNATFYSARSNQDFNNAMNKTPR